MSSTMRVVEQPAGSQKAVVVVEHDADANFAQSAYRVCLAGSGKCSVSG